VYNREYYQGKRHTQVTPVDEVRRFDSHWWANRYYAGLCRRYLRASGAPRRFLELGCAHGYLLAWLESEAECFGVDVSDYALGRSRTICPKARTARMDLERERLTDRFDRGSFGAILAKYVLEHLERPEEVVRTAGECLAPGGFLIFSVPNTRSRLRGLKGAQWIGVRDATHRSVLAPEEWYAICARAGLEVRRSFSDGFWDMPYLRRVPRAVQWLMFGIPAVVQVLFIGQWMPVPLGENLIVVAQRRARG
jgi:SAM-dependent methyltransferase